MNTKTTKPFEMWTAWDCLGRHDCRPVIVISQEGDTDTVTVIPLTSDRESTQLPTHVLISEQGLDHTSRALCEKVKTIRRKTLIRRIGCVYEPYDPAVTAPLPPCCSSQAQNGTRRKQILFYRRYDP